MGRTLLPPTALIKQEKELWADYRRALRKEDRDILDALFAKALHHSGEIACAERTYPFEGMLISILIEQEKHINELNLRLLSLEEGGSGRNQEEVEAGEPQGIPENAKEASAIATAAPTATILPVVAAVLRQPA